MSANPVGASAGGIELTGVEVEYKRQNPSDPPPVGASRSPNRFPPIAPLDVDVTVSETI